MTKSLIYRTLAALALLFAVPTLRAEEESQGPNCFVIVDINGVETEFFGSAINFMLDENGNTIVVADADSEDYQIHAEWALDSVKEIIFDTREKSGIVKPVIPENNVELQFGSGVLKVNGAHEGDKLRVFAANGRLMATHTLDGEDCAYSLASLPAGFYIVEIAGTTLKIVKK